MAVFGATSLLFLLLAERPKEQARAVGAALLLGFGIEFMQFAFGLAPVFEWWDVRDDAFGVLGVLVICQGLRWGLPKRK